MLLEHAFESGAPFDATLVTNVDLVCNEIVRDFVAQKFTSAPRIAVERFFENSWISALEGLAREALQRPDVPVLPARPGEVDLAGELARWQRAWDEIREGMRLSWNRDEILALLSDSDVLKQGEYKEPEIRILAPVEEALDSTAILGRRAVDYGLLKLSPDTLRKGTKKNRIGETPDHPFFDACGRFAQPRRGSLSASMIGPLAIRTTSLPLPQRRCAAGTRRPEPLPSTTSSSGSKWHSGGRTPPGWLRPCMRSSAPF